LFLVPIRVKRVGMDRLFRFYRNIRLFGRVGRLTQGLAGRLYILPETPLALTKVFELLSGLIDDPFAYLDVPLMLSHFAPARFSIIHHINATNMPRINGSPKEIVANML
jgi:hypothetical protein